MSGVIFSSILALQVRTPGGSVLPRKSPINSPGFVGSFVHREKEDGTRSTARDAFKILNQRGDVEETANTVLQLQPGDGGKGGENGEKSIPVTIDMPIKEYQQFRMTQGSFAGTPESQEKTAIQDEKVCMRSSQFAVEDMRANCKH